MQNTKRTEQAANNSNRPLANGSRNELMPIIQSENNELLVDARLLHQRLGAGRDFSNWIKDRIKDYGFVEGEDFLLTKFGEQRKQRGGHNKIEYHLTLDTAKELSMVEKTAIGRAFRRYFIAAEK